MKGEVISREIKAMMMRYETSVKATFAAVSDLYQRITSIQPILTAIGISIGPLPSLSIPPLSIPELQIDWIIPSTNRYIMYMKFM